MADISLDTENIFSEPSYSPQPRRRRMGANSRLSPNRLFRYFIVAAIITSFILGTGWFISASPYAEPLKQALQPVAEPTWNFLVAVIDDPLGIDWGAKVFTVAALMLPHMGMLALLDDRMR